MLKEILKTIKQVDSLIRPICIKCTISCEQFNMSPFKALNKQSENQTPLQSLIIRTGQLDYLYSM